MAIGQTKTTKKSHLQQQVGMVIKTKCHSDAVKLMKMDKTVKLNGMKTLVELFVQEKAFQ